MGPQPAARTAGLANPAMGTLQNVLGMCFMPGQAFLADVQDDSTLRLSISNHTPETIGEGLKRLTAAVADLPMPAGARVR
jgi:DNA-binding transcriptional MocR family regulator